MEHFIKKLSTGRGNRKVFFIEPSQKSVDKSLEVA